MLNLAITQEKKEDMVLLQLAGRLDTLSSDELSQTFNELIEQEELKILVDFAQLEFISSSGLRVLISTGKTMNQLKGKFFFCNLKDKVKDIFDMAGFSMLFHIFESREEAMEQL